MTAEGVRYLPHLLLRQRTDLRCHVCLRLLRHRLWGFLWAMCNAMLDAALSVCPLCWLLAFPLALGPAGIYLGQAFSPILPALAGLCYFRLRCRRS